MTEKEIRVVVGDNVGTGKALRSLISQGHLKRMGRGKRSSLLRLFQSVISTCQVVRVTLSFTKSSLDSSKCPSIHASKGRSCNISICLKSKLDAVLHFAIDAADNDP
jgi:hypothetical protein